MVSEVTDNIWVKQSIGRLMARQEYFISQFKQPLSSSMTLESRNSVYDNFSRGIFFIKEFLLLYRDKLTRDDFDKIQHQVTRQLNEINHCLSFLQKSLQKTIR